MTGTKVPLFQAATTAHNALKKDTFIYELNTSLINTWLMFNQIYALKYAFVPSDML